MARIKKVTHNSLFTIGLAPETSPQPLFLTWQESQQSTANSRSLAAALPPPTTYHLLTTLSFNNIPAFNA